MECCGVADGCGVEQSEVECWEWSSLNSEVECCGVEQSEVECCGVERSEVECCGVEQSEVECWGVNNLKWNVLE